MNFFLVQSHQGVFSLDLNIIVTPYSNTLLNLLWEWKDFNKPRSNPSSHYSFFEPWTFCWGSLLVYKRAKLFLLEILSYFFHWKLFFPGIPGSYVINHYLRNKHFDSNKHGEINSRNGDATKTINPKKANPATTWNKNSSLKIMIYIFQWLNHFLVNKSTTIFHCPYSYRPQKWCQNFQTQVEPGAAGEWFHVKVLNILMPFLWWIRVHTMENCCWFVFYNNIHWQFLCPFLLKFLRILSNRGELYCYWT